MAVRGEELSFFLVVLVSAAALLLLFSLWVARRARKPSARKPPRKTFEHGRRLARANRPSDTEGAVHALEHRCPVGDIAALRVGEDAVDVTIARRRNQPCAQAAGYLAGLFESAWAHEVLVAHPQCGGESAGTCRYVVQRAPTLTGISGEGSPIRGSADARRRSPPARPGGA